MPFSFEEAEFEVDATEPFDLKVFRRVGDAIFTIAGMRFHLTAIQGYLMDEAAIVDALVAVYEVTMKNPDFERLRQAPRLLLQQELVPLSEWVAQWMQGGVDVPLTECAWRADLVRACAVNWLQSAGPNAGAVAFWELTERRLLLGELGHHLFGLVQPAFRQLPPGNRVGVLLAAYRLWYVLQPPSGADRPPMPQLSAEGWRWLAARSSCRSDEQRYNTVQGIAGRFGKIRRTHRRRKPRRG